jgi:hypothetical protein
MKRYWMGPVPKVDDFGIEIEGEFIDGATYAGPWAIMTPDSHSIYGRGIGQGRGQRYRRQVDGRWLKVEG